MKLSKESMLLLKFNLQLKGKVKNTRKKNRAQCFPDFHGVDQLFVEMVSMLL